MEKLLSLYQEHIKTLQNRTRDALSRHHFDNEIGRAHV